MNNIKSNQSQIIVRFEVKPTIEGKQSYLDIAFKLGEELKNIEGFISSERFESMSESGKMLSINVWESEETLNKWRNNTKYRKAQKLGFNSLFEHYNIKVASIIRDYSIAERKQAPKDSQIIIG